MAMLWCAVEALTRPRFALGAGLAAATAIAGSKWNGPRFFGLRDAA